MATGAAAAQQAGGGAPQGAQGTNPFWEVTNQFSQKNKQGLVTGYQLGTSTLDGGGQINPGNFLRAMRLVVATSTAGTGGALNADYPGSFFKQAGLENTDGAEILYNVISGYEYVQAQRFFRPWLVPPELRGDYSASVTNPAFTLMLTPEVRQQLGVLENTDTRSQYNWSQTINSVGNIYSTAPTTNPIVSVTPYVDMWAQPDAEDLEKVPNQRIPAGVNLQTKLRHQAIPMTAAGSDFNFLSTLTGNAVRGQLLIARDGNNARQDAFTDPIQWQTDNRNMSSVNPEIYFEWAEDFYRVFGGISRPTGVYPFPRFYNPGNLQGQGWLYTSNATSEYWETTIASGIVANGTVTLLQEEVYATGPVDPSLIDL